jgi:hypothetical protein
MAEVGFEMLIFSFGSGFKLETADASYLHRIKEQASRSRLIPPSSRLVCTAPRKISL